MQTSISLPFADGHYTFKLTIKRIVEIERKAGPIDAVKDRLLRGGWGIWDVVEVIRQGLIGGASGLASGVDVPVNELLANTLIDTYVDGTDLAVHHVTARSIIAALFVGYEPAAVAQKKSPQPGKPKRRRSSTGDSLSTTAGLSA